MTRLLLIALAACGQPSPVASPTPVYPPDAAPDPSAPDAAPDGAGELPMAVVDEHMEDIRAKVRACAEATTYEGKVQVQVTIAPDGAATAAILDGDPQVDGCVQDAFAGATFPASERGQRFTYAFTF